MTDHLTTHDIVQTELRRLRDHKIKYDYKQCGSKNYAVINLDNGKKLMVDVYRRTIIYRQKTYKYKYLEKWMQANDLRVK